MGLMMVVLWCLVVALVVYVERAEQILDERLARGEIDAEEYKQRRDLLSTR
jgi:hypothetical protein